MKGNNAYGQAEYADPPIATAVYGSSQGVRAEPTQTIHTTSIPVNPVPIYAPNAGGVSIHFTNEEHQERMMLTYRLSRAICWLALLSIFFALIMFLISGNALYLIMMIGPIVGYYGARDYNVNLLYFFVGYYFLAIGLYVYLMATSQAYAAILIVLCYIFIIRYLMLLIQLILECSPEDISFLRDPPTDSVIIVGNQRMFYVV